MAISQKCTAKRLDGQPCKSWARRGSYPPLCSVHAQSDHGKVALGERSDQSIIQENSSLAGRKCPHTLEEIATFLRENADSSLDDELVIARLALRRLMQHLEEQLTPHEFAHLAGVIFTGTNSIVRLLEAKKDLENYTAEEFARAMNQALDELSEEMNLRL
jgi:hypothetical protein